MLVVLIGVGAGLGGAALLELLRAVEHLAWSYHGPVANRHFLEAVERSTHLHRVLIAAARRPHRRGQALLLAGGAGTRRLGGDLAARGAPAVRQEHRPRQR